MSMFRNILMSEQGGGLPSEYQQVEYIETNTGYQQLDTGIQVNPPQLAKIRLAFKTVTDCPVLGEKGTTRNYIMCSLAGSSQRNWQLNYNGNWLASSTKPTANTTYDFEGYLSNGSQYMTIDGNRIYTNTITGTPSATTNLVLINMDSTSWKSSLKLYSCQIYNDNTLVCDLVPCYRKSDNVIGMYDLVQRDFKVNQLNGTFTKGADV